MYILIYDNEFFSKQTLNFKELKEVLASYLVDKISNFAIKDLLKFKKVEELKKFVKILSIRKNLKIEIMEE